VHAVAAGRAGAARRLVDGFQGGALTPADVHVPWTDRVHAWRDRLIASPRFRRWAAAFPLSRPVARRRTRALFDLCAGFVYSQVLTACVQLRLFDILADGPLTVEQLSARVAVPGERMGKLLLAAVSLKLVAHRRGGRFGLGPLGAAMVGNAAVDAMVLHHPALYADLADPVALLRQPGEATETSRYWAYSGNDGAVGLSGGEVSPYTALMAASQVLLADEVLSAYRIGRHRCLLDVGGGDGSFLRAAGQRAAGLDLMLFDLPPVVAEAKARFAEAGMAERVVLTAGDFLRDALPPGADIISLVRVIHDHDDPVALGILRAARAALPPGGTVMVAEPLAGTRGAEPIGDAYFGFYLMAMGRGRVRTQSELTVLLISAGFDHVRLVPTDVPLLTSVVVARA